MMYSLDEAATLLSEKLNKTVTARQIRELAIHGETNLRLLYRGKAINCVSELEEEVYGYPYVLCGYITEIEMHGSYPVNQFIFNETIYKIEEGVGIALNLTSDKLLIDEEQINLLIIRAGTMPTTKTGDAGGAIKASINITEMWLAEAQSQGKIYMEAWRKAGYDPTIANIGLYVEGYFSDNQIYNSRKEVIDRATIVRSALTGITGNKVGHKTNKLKIPDGKVGGLPEMQ